MASTDPEKERQRLTDFYSHMTDDELQKIAEDLASLTEVARQVLHAEGVRRRITLLSDAQHVDAYEPELRNLVTIRQFRDLTEALLAKGSLDSSGIECFLADDNIVRMDWFISNLVGGVKLKVKPEDVEAANLILEQPIPEDFDVEGIGQYQQPRCPSCRSLDVSFEELNKPFAYGTAWAGLPIPFQRKGWNCRLCGQQWRNEDILEDGGAV
jgi:Putative prokaryotic signal transducing protein